MKTFTTLTTLTTTAALALAAAGCGDSASSGSSSSKEQEATPTQAAAKARETSAALDKALATYRKGDAKAAEQQVGDAYLESFEDVEHQLEARDHELKEELEHQVATTIRAKMKAKAPVGEVAAEVRDAQRGLSQAEAKLR